MKFGTKAINMNEKLNGMIAMCPSLSPDGKFLFLLVTTMVILTPTGSVKRLLKN